MENILLMDIVVCAVLVFSAVVKGAKGLYKYIMPLLVTVAAIIGALILSRVLTPVVTEAVYPKVEDRVVEIMQEKQEELGEELLLSGEADVLGGKVKELLPEPLLKLGEKLGQLDDIFSSVADKVGESASSLLTDMQKDKLKGKILTAFFKDTKKFELDRAITEGNTEIYSSGKTALADKGEYIAEKRIVYLYDNVKIKDNKGYTATSENGMYNFDTKKITLNNNVKITKANNTAITDKAIYYQDKDEFHLIGNVKISQQGTTASANKGIYFVKKNIVELLDNVVIERNGNIVRGDKAISDFNTSKSKLIAQKGGRISGKLIENKLKD